MFLECYNLFSPQEAYFLPTHGNGEVPVLEKLAWYLPYCIILVASLVGQGF
jgi:hypothetical protein